MNLLGYGPIVAELNRSGAMQAIALLLDLTPNERAAHIDRLRKAVSGIPDYDPLRHVYEGALQITADAARELERMGL